MTQAPARRICPYCQSTFAEGARLVACPACGMAHHADCWTQNGGCAAVRCGKREVDPVPIAGAAAEAAGLAAVAAAPKPAPLPPDAVRLLDEISLRAQQGLLPQAQERLAQLRGMVGELHPAVHEAEGDLAMAARRFRDAEAHYRAARDADPDNARVEEKFATALVRVHMPEYLATLPPDDDDEAIWWVRHIIPRPPWAAAVLSGLVPGMGQWYNGDFAKGAAIIVAYTVCAWLQLTPMVSTAMAEWRAGATHDHAVAVVTAQANPLLIAIIIALALYAVIDAALVARAANQRR